MARYSPEDYAGEFVMSFEDMQRYFNQYCVNLLFSDKNKKVIYSAWEGRSAAGAREHRHFAHNPQFALEVPQSDHGSLVWLTLTQRDAHLSQRGELFAIHLELVEPAVHHAKTRHLTNPLSQREYDKGTIVASTGSYKRMRDVTLAGLDLKPGFYFLIASTSEPHEEGPFHITVRASDGVGTVGFANERIVDLATSEGIEVAESTARSFESWQHSESTYSTEQTVLTEKAEHIIEILKERGQGRRAKDVQILIDFIRNDLEDPEKVDEGWYAIEAGEKISVSLRKHGDEASARDVQVLVEAVRNKLEANNKRSEKQASRQQRRHLHLHSHQVSRAEKVAVRLKDRGQGRRAKDVKVLVDFIRNDLEDPDKVDEGWYAVEAGERVSVALRDDGDEASARDVQVLVETIRNELKERDSRKRKVSHTRTEHHRDDSLVTTEGIEVLRTPRSPSRKRHGTPTEEEDPVYAVDESGHQQVYHNDKPRPRSKSTYREKTRHVVTAVEDEPRPRSRSSHRRRRTEEPRSRSSHRSVETVEEEVVDSPRRHRKRRDEPVAEAVADKPKSRSSHRSVERVEEEVVDSPRRHRKRRDEPVVVPVEDEPRQRSRSRSSHRSVERVEEEVVDSPRRHRKRRDEPVVVPVEDEPRQRSRSRSSHRSVERVEEEVVDSPRRHRKRRDEPVVEAVADKPKSRSSHRSVETVEEEVVDSPRRHRKRRDEPVVEAVADKPKSRSSHRSVEAVEEEVVDSPRRHRKHRDEPVVAAVVDAEPGHKSVDIVRKSRSRDVHAADDANDVHVLLERVKNAPRVLKDDGHGRAAHDVAVLYDWVRNDMDDKSKGRDALAAVQNVSWSLREDGHDDLARDVDVLYEWLKNELEDDSDRDQNDVHVLLERVRNAPEVLREDGHKRSARDVNVLFDWIRNDFDDDSKAHHGRNALEAVQGVSDTLRKEGYSSLARDVDILYEWLKNDLNTRSGGAVPSGHKMKKGVAARWLKMWIMLTLCSSVRRPSAVKQRQRERSKSPTSRSGRKVKSDLSFIDKDKDGEVDLKEFLAAGGSKDLFRQLDKNQDGVLDLDEPARQLEAQKQAQQQAAQEELEQIDKDNDGAVDLEEFLAAGGTERQFKALDVNKDGLLEADMDNVVKIDPSLAVKVLICGDGACGKVACSPPGSSYVPTAASNHEVSWEDENDQEIEFALWDTAGQESLEHLRSIAYPGTKICLMAYDMTSQDSLQNVQHVWLAEFKARCNDYWSVILVGTKHDLWEQVQGDDDVPTWEDGREMAKKIKACAFVCTSAKDKYGVLDDGDEHEPDESGPNEQYLRERIIQLAALKFNDGYDTKYRGWLE